MALSIDVLSSYPPVQEAEVDKVLAEEIRDNEKKIVVLDDDPTGVYRPFMIFLFIRIGRRQALNRDLLRRINFFTY